jgi:hypothetical protein
VGLYAASNQGNLPPNASEIAILGDSVNEYIEAAVPAAAETSLFSFTVPVGKTFFFHGVSYTGLQVGEVRTYINSLIKGRSRTGWGNYSGFQPHAFTKFPAGTTFDVRVFHMQTGSHLFNINFLGVLN